MNIAQCLMYLFPDAVPDRDYIVQDDGQGQYIAEWDLPDPQPTQAELEAVWPEVQAELAREEIKRQLAETDSGMARVIEDLIELLASKGVIAESELPQPTQDKITSRRNLRTQL
jgi:hypothetical protein